MIRATDIDREDIFRGRGIAEGMTYSMRLVWLYLLEYPVIRPSARELAEILGMHRWTINEALVQIEEKLGQRGEYED